MLLSAHDQSSQILLMLCFTACTEEKAKYAQGRLITLCLGDSVLRQLVIVIFSFLRS